ncbi:MAG: bifunctional DNA primase/polymerase [Sphingobium sp.]
MSLKVGQFAEQDGHLELTRFADVAERLHRNDYSTFAIPEGSKKATRVKWQSLCFRQPSDAELAYEIKLYPDYGAAIACGRCFALDIDFLDREVADRAESIARRLVPGEPLVRYGQYPKRVLLYRCETPLPLRRVQGADLLGKGSYVMAFGIHPVTKAPYRWVGASPLTRPLADLPVITLDQAIAVRAAWAELTRPVVFAMPTTTDSVDRVSELIADGRDDVMLRAVWTAWASGVEDRQEIIEKAWAIFSKAVDLVRPARDGLRPWSKQDVARKVDYLLKSGKSRPPTRAYPDLSAQAVADLRQLFARAVDRIGAAGKLAPATIRISHYMLTLCGGEAGCYIGAETLAAQLDLALGTVKRARAKLVAHGLWSRRVARGGGRGNLAYFHPMLEQARMMAETVTKNDAGNSSRGEGDLEENTKSLGKEKEENTHQSLFESLASWDREAGK